MTPEQFEQLIKTIKGVAGDVTFSIWLCTILAISFGAFSK